MKPDKKAAVLADYHSKKATSATELAKLHGVSRSSVYRLLQKEAAVKAEAAAPIVAPRKPSDVVSAPKQKKPETAPPSDDEDDVEDFDSEDEQRFLLKSDKFAEDLGLPMVGSNLVNVEGDGKAPEEREEELDGAVDVIFGGGNTIINSVPPALLERVFDDDEPAPPQRQRSRREEVIHVIPRIDRNDVIQRIIFNVQNFGPLLATIVGPQPDAFIAVVQKMGDDELVSTLTTLERTRSVGNIAAGFKQTFYMVAQATEITTTFLGVKAHGFTERLRAEEQQVAMIMKELAIENWERVKAMDSPTARLGILFCMTLAQTDASNRLTEALKPSLSSRVSPGTEAAHADL